MRRDAKQFRALATVVVGAGVLTLLSFLFSVSGCDQDYSGECATDGDCGSGELCDFISGQCVVGGLDFQEGIFGGDFMCEVGGSVAEANFSGQSTVYGGWWNAPLVLDYLISPRRKGRLPGSAMRLRGRCISGWSTRTSSPGRWISLSYRASRWYPTKRPKGLEA